MKPRALPLIAAALIFIILLTACGQGQTNPPATSVGTTPQPVNTVASVPRNTAIPVPSDVPIMEGAYELDVPTELNVMYKVDKPIKDVVDFYQQALPQAGWEQPTNPDSVVGSMAQMARTKANGDRITFSIQYNPVGEFTIVQIYITRVPQ